MAQRGAKREATGDALRIDVSWRLRTKWRAESLLTRAARHAALAEGLERGSLSIAVVGAAAMARLHWQFMRVTGATDVLTFDLAGAPRRGWIDGEVVVCADVARRSVSGRAAAPLRGWQTAARCELALYVVHGVLHLAGYDDRSAAAARRMHRREDELLSGLGLGRVYESGS